MTAPACKLCGRVCAKREGVYLPACATCWENYLNGDTRDTGAMAQSAYTPPLERDGVRAPYEASTEGLNAAARAATGGRGRSPVDD